MNSSWRLIFAAGTVLLAGMALYAIWFDTLAPVVFVKAFISLVVLGLVLSVVQSTFRSRSPPQE